MVVSAVHPKDRTRWHPPPVPVATGTAAAAVVVAAALILLFTRGVACGIQAAWWLLLDSSALPTCGASPPLPPATVLMGGQVLPRGESRLLLHPTLGVGGREGGGWAFPATTARIMKVGSGDEAVDEQMDLCTDAAARCVEVEGTAAACRQCVAECSEAADAVMASSVLSDDDKSELIYMAREQSERCEEDMST